MSSTRRIAIGIGIAASGALLTAFLLTGERKTKTRQFVVRRAENLKKSLKTTKKSFDDSEVHYI
jgi:hypothetical protein